VQELATDGFDYKPGHGGDIVLVRAFYKRRTFTDLLNMDFSNMAGGYRLLAAASAFRNEPFPW
jgi:hypothetical protein